MLHGRHICSKSSDMINATMFTYSQYDHALTHWKYVLRCCAECPCINIPNQETDNQNSDTTPSIRFHIYHIIGRCTSHGRMPLKDKKHVTCVNKNLHQKNQQRYTPEKS